MCLKNSSVWRWETYTCPRILGKEKSINTLNVVLSWIDDGRDASITHGQICVQGVRLEFLCPHFFASPHPVCTLILGHMRRRALTINLNYVRGAKICYSGAE